MAAPIEINRKELQDITDNLKGNEMFGPAMKRGLGRIAVFLEGEVRTRTRVDTGRARNSVNSVVDGQAIPEWAVIGSKLEYIEALEEGSEPHWPPVGALQPWARRHGFPAGRSGDFLVRRAISRTGTVGDHMFRDAVDENVSAVNDLIGMIERDIINGF